MKQFTEDVYQKVNTALESVEYVEKNINRQVNKDLLPLIKKTIVNIKNGDFEKLDDLKQLVYGSGRPEGSGPDNDIFSIGVHANGILATSGVAVRVGTG